MCRKVDGRGSLINNMDVNDKGFKMLSCSASVMLGENLK